MKLKTYLQILSLILIAGLMGYFLVPKYTFYHPRGERFIIKSNRFTGLIEKYDFDQAAPTKYVPLSDEERKEVWKAEHNDEVNFTPLK